MKTVAISLRVDLHSDRHEIRDALDQKMVKFILAAGYMPLFVPNVLINSAEDKTFLSSWLSAFRPDAILLSGGNDIGECPERERTEVALLEYARLYRLPVLGICHGMQMLAHNAGIGLQLVQGHVRSRHGLHGEITHEVNSYHNFALASCPAEYEPIAYSSDGVIEAIRHRSLSWEGWMWHPEREAHFHPNDLQRLQFLFASHE